MNPKIFIRKTKKYEACDLKLKKVYLIIFMV